MGYLGTLDYCIIAIYFFLLVGLGVYLSKRASASLDDYFLAGRKMPWWALGISGMGWSLDITGTMLIVSLMYLLGPRSLFVEFRGGVPLGLVFTMIWTGKWHRRSGCMTGAEWLAFRFGDGIGANFARITKVIATIVFTIGMLVYMIKGVGLFFSMFIPLTPLQCSLIMVGVATLYTISSGFYGVVFSDVIQCLLIFVGIIFITALALVKMGGETDLGTLTRSVTGCTDWLSSFPQQITTMPKGYEVYESLFMFTVFLLLRNIIMGFGTGDDPHYFAARNERDCGKLACLWMSLSTFRWPMMISFAILGLFIVKDMFPDQSVLSEAALLIKQQLGHISQTGWADALANIMNDPSAYPDGFIANLKDLLGADWNSKLHLLSFDGTINAERILPTVLLCSVPAGFRGLILVSLLAASMSTFDTTINKAASFFTRDIYQRYLRPKAVNRELIAITYLFTIALIASAFGMAYSVKSINDIWGWITMGLLSGLAVPSLLKMYWWRFNGGGFAIGTVAGTASAVVQRIFWPDLPEQWQFVILTLFTAACTIIGTYLTKPTDHDILVNFYKATRPFGFWKPLRYVLSEDATVKMKKEHRNDLLAIPFVMTWLVTMFLMPMQLIIRQYYVFCVTLGLFVVSVIFIYIFWFKNLPDKDVTNSQQMVSESE